MQRLAVATTNLGKLHEIEQVLVGLPFELVTLSHWPDVAAPEETGKTFAENARAKALYYASRTGELTVAEDSGLEIDALDGGPGVESARFGGPEATYPEKFELIERFKFFHELAWKRVSRGKRFVQRLARYRCGTDNYRWPVEMLFTRWLVPVQKLS